MAIRIRNRVNYEQLLQKLLREQGDEIAQDLDGRLVKLEQQGLTTGNYLPLSESDINSLRRKLT